MQKLIALFSALRKGSMLTNPALWKTAQGATNALAIFLLSVVAVVQAFGVDVGVSEHDAHDIAGGIVAAVGVLNLYWTYATSEKVGLPNKASDGGAEEESEKSIMGR